MFRENLAFVLSSWKKYGRNTGVDEQHYERIDLRSLRGRWYQTVNHHQLKFPRLMYGCIVNFARDESNGSNDLICLLLLISASPQHARSDPSSSWITVPPGSSVGRTQDYKAWALYLEDACSIQAPENTFVHRLLFFCYSLSCGERNMARTYCVFQSLARRSKEIYYIMKP